MAKKKAHHKSHTKKNHKQSSLHQSATKAINATDTKELIRESKAEVDNSLDKVRFSAQDLNKSTKDSSSEIFENDPVLVIRDIRQTIWTTAGILISYSLLIIVLRQTELGSKLISLIKL